MELLSFPLLVVEFIKHQSDLASRGYSIDLRSSSNIFQDQFIIYKVSNSKTFQFMFQHRLWDRYHEFSLNIGSSYMSNIENWQHYRLNPTNKQIIQVQRNNHNSRDYSYNPWSVQESFSDELRSFAEEIVQMINHLIEKIQSDKFLLDSTEF
ncbi:MAG: hypothetical protein WD512_12265 [Candidatus Paceibacterota bacterium]